MSNFITMTTHSKVTRGFEALKEPGFIGLIQEHIMPW